MGDADFRLVHFLMSKRGSSGKPINHENTEAQKSTGLRSELETRAIYAD